MLRPLRSLSFSTLISVMVHAVLFLLFVTQLHRLDPQTHVRPPLEVILAPEPVKQSASAPKRQEVPVLSTQGKTTYHVSAHYADEVVLAQHAHLSQRRVISASSHEARDADYLAYWRERVEQEGTQVYRTNPAVRDHKGELRVLVAIAADGSLAEVQIRASSGDPVLDQLAVDIVKAAAPFKPLSQDMAQDTDILEIIRTWRFTHEGQAQVSMR